jgi:hypothetical protein
VRLQARWLQNFRRIFVRYERVAENFLGMLHEVRLMHATLAERFV